MTITTPDGLLTGLTAGPRFNIRKTMGTAKAILAPHSLWKATSAGGFPPAGSDPPGFTAGSGYIPTDATTGAFPFTNPTAPARSYLANILLMDDTQPGIIMFADRMWACSAISAVSIITQTVTTPGALPSGRDPNSGLDVEPWLEIYAAVGANASTWTLTGTDAVGNTGRTWTYNQTASMVAGEMRKFVPGTAATPGIRVVTSIINSVSNTGTNVGITLLRNLGYINYGLITGSVGNQKMASALDLGLARVYDDACIQMIAFPAATAAGELAGFMSLAQA